MPELKIDFKNLGTVRFMALDTSALFLPFGRPVSDYLRGPLGSENGLKRKLQVEPIDFPIEVYWRESTASQLRLIDLSEPEPAPAEPEPSIAGFLSLALDQISLASVAPSDASPRAAELARRFPALPLFETQVQLPRIDALPLRQRMTLAAPPAPPAHAPESKTAARPVEKPAPAAKTAQPAPAARPATPAPSVRPAAAPAPPPKPAAAVPAAPPAVRPAEQVPPPAARQTAPAPAPPKPTPAPKPVVAPAPEPAEAQTVPKPRPAAAPPAPPRPAAPPPAPPKIAPPPAARQSVREVAPEPSRPERHEPPVVERPAVERPQPIVAAPPPPPPTPVPSFGGVTSSSSSSTYGLDAAETQPGFIEKIPMAAKVGGPVVALVVIGYFIFGSGGSQPSRPSGNAGNAAITVGEQGWVNEWASDTVGSRRGRQMTLYRPSMQLSDYQFQFSGLIESKAMGWVFRAADTKNYYGVKLEIIRPGVVGITRFAVVEGRESSNTQKPLPMQASPNASFIVKTVVAGPSFTISVNGQPVEVWTDNRLKSGGVGFMNERDERGKIDQSGVQFSFNKAGQ